MKNKRKRNFVVDDDESYSENSDVYFEEEVDFELERELRESRENMKSVLQKSLQSTPKEKEFSEPMETTTEIIQLPSPSKVTSIIFTASKSPPSPLAHKEYKRRKLTEFLFDSPFHHPSPSLYHYPYVSAVVITSTSVNSITSSSNSTFSKPNFGLIKNKKLKKSASWLESQSEEQLEEIEGMDGETKEESTNVSRIMEAIRSLGGKATGNDISSWICKQYSSDITMKKRLSYTVNAVLSSKKHSGLFSKEMVYFDGHKRALWSLSATSLNAESASLDGERDSIISREHKSKSRRIELESFISGAPSQIPTDEEPETDVGEEVYNAEEELKKKLEEKKIDESNIKEESSVPVRDSKIGRHAHHNDPLSSRNDNLDSSTRSDRGETKTEESRKDEDPLEEDDVYVNMAAFSGDTAEETNETSNNEPKEEARDEMQNKRQTEGTSVDEKTDAADNSNGSQPNEESESSAERIIDDEEISDVHENGVADELKDTSDAEGRRASDDNISGEDVEGQKDDGDKNSDKPSYSSRRKMKFDEEVIEDIELDEKDASTYTEMIEQALRALGGRGTGLDITTYIDEHYRSVLKNKTDTWRNSVMGCLSANRRNLFSKEPVKEHAKRYVWKLNDPAFAAESPKSSVLSKRRKKADSAPETPQTPMSGTEDKVLKRKNSNSPEKNGKEEKPKSRSESPVDSPTTNSPPTPFNDDGSGNGNFLQLIMDALKSMGGKATGNDITDWIAQNYKEHGSNKKKLTYTVNAILSSKKYAGIFSKDQMINNGQRALWKLSHTNGNTKGRGKKT